MLRGGANGADLGPVPWMHALTGHADELAVYPPTAVASQVDGRPGEGAGIRLLHQSEHVGYVRTHEWRELVRAGKAPVRCLRVDHLDHKERVQFGPPVRNGRGYGRHRRAGGQLRHLGPRLRVMLVRNGRERRDGGLVTARLPSSLGKMAIDASQRPPGRIVQSSVALSGGCRRPSPQAPRAARTAPRRHITDSWLSRVFP